MLPRAAAVAGTTATSSAAPVAAASKPAAAFASTTVTTSAIAAADAATALTTATAPGAAVPSTSRRPTTSATSTTATIATLVSAVDTIAASVALAALLSAIFAQRGPAAPTTTAAVPAFTSIVRAICPTTPSAFSPATSAPANAAPVGCALDPTYFAIIAAAVHGSLRPASVHVVSSIDHAGTARQRARHLLVRVSASTVTASSRPCISDTNADAFAPAALTFATTILASTSAGLPGTTEQSPRFSATAKLASPAPPNTSTARHAAAVGTSPTLTASTV